MNTIKPGLEIKNESMELIVVRFACNGKNNLALVHNTNGNCYYTVVDLTHTKGDCYYRYRSHYFSIDDKKEVYKDFNELKKDLD